MMQSFTIWQKCQTIVWFHEITRGRTLHGTRKISWRFLNWSISTKAMAHPADTGAKGDGLREREASWTAVARHRFSPRRIASTFFRKQNRSMIYGNAPNRNDAVAATDSGDALVARKNRCTVWLGGRLRRRGVADTRCDGGVAATRSATSLFSGIVPAQSAQKKGFTKAEIQPAFQGRCA
jgi:hypothetical protein